MEMVGVSRGVARRERSRRLDCHPGFKHCPASKHGGEWGPSMRQRMKGGGWGPSPAATIPPGPTIHPHATRQSSQHHAPRKICANRTASLIARLSVPPPVGFFRRSGTGASRFEMPADDPARQKQPLQDPIQTTASRPSTSESDDPAKQVNWQIRLKPRIGGLAHPGPKGPDILEGHVAAQRSIRANHLTVYQDRGRENRGRHDRWTQLMPIYVKTTGTWTSILTLVVAPHRPDDRCRSSLRRRI